MGGVELVVATRNGGKLQEIRAALEGLPLTLLSLADLAPGVEIPLIPEEGESYRQNAIRKATTVAHLSHRLTLADDSGLEVDALGGAPGPHTARLAGEGASDAQRIGCLLELLEGVPLERRTARFRCVIALADPRPGGEVVCCEGVCEGVISLEPRGDQGFGYDPVFLLPAYQQTLAELGPSVKGRISHRAQALTQVRQALRQLL